MEDRSRAKSGHVKKIQKHKVENMTAPTFDYGEIMVNERIKVDLFKELVGYPDGYYGVLQVPW